MGIDTKRLTNGNVYIDGNSLMGKVDECKLPEIVMTMSEHKALGMIGKLELPNGVFEKMTATFKWNSFYADTLKKVANPFGAIECQLRGSIETYGNAGRTAQVPYVAYITGTFNKLPLGGFKQGDNVDAESAMAVTYCKMEIDGEEIVELDVFANIYRAGGVDLLETYRINIGG